MTTDQPLSENSTWGGCGQIIRRFLGTFEHMHLSIIISIRTLGLNVKACFVSRTTFVLLSILLFFSLFFFTIGIVCLDNRDNH